MLRILIIAVLLSASGTLSLTAQTRHAFVVGIDTYDNVASLAKARNDARSVATALEEVGFRTQLLIDVDETALLTELTRFSGQLDPGDEVVFYFAGHGVEINGRNYLLPADVPSVAPGQELVVTRGALPVSDVIDQFNARGVRLSLLILDACRDNPFETLGTRSLGRSVGLGREEAPEGTFVMFSAGAGQQALDRLSTDDPNPNSVFTRVLLPRLTQPGLPLRTMVREVRSEVRALGRSVAHEQFPAVYDQLDGAFTFVPVAALPDPIDDGPVAPPTSSPVVSDPCAAARADWPLIGENPSVALLEAYRAAHSGCSLMVTLASERLAALSDGPSVTPPVVTPPVVTPTPSPPTVTTPTPIATPSTVTTPTPIPTPTPQGGSFDVAQLLQACVAVAGPNVSFADLQTGAGLERARRACGEVWDVMVDRSSPDGIELTALIGRIAHARGDFAEAAGYYQTAANGGNAVAANSLGGLYERGEGVVQNGQTATNWFRTAGELGDANGWYNFADSYLAGNIVPQNYDVAFQGFQVAAEQGHGPSMYQLGRMYQEGTGVALDASRANDWYTRGVEAGEPQSAVRLGIAYFRGQGVGQDRGRAARLFRQAADAGNASGMRNTGVMYREGFGVPLNQSEATRWFERAIAHGDAFAHIYLGWQHQYGNGMQIDNREAANWFMSGLAAGSDHPIRNPNEFDGVVGRELQTQLRDRGYYNGAIDGAVGPGTIAAMQAFYDANN